MTPMDLRLLRGLAPALLAGLLAVTACTDSSGTASDRPGGLDPGRDGVGNPDGSGTTDLTSDDILLTSGLVTVDDCDALLARIQDHAYERVGPYGFDLGGPIAAEGRFAFEEDFEATDVPDAAETAEVAPSTAAEGGEFAAPQAGRDAAAPAADGDDAAADGSGNLASTDDEGSFSETNNQELGVDEADLVKTDGRWLVAVFGNRMQVIDTTGSTPELTRTITLPGDTYGGELFLEGDRALLMSTGWTERPFLDASIDTSWYPGSPVGTLIEIDLVGGDVVRTLEFEGGYLSAREIDGTIRIVLTASGQRLAWVYPSNQGAEDVALEANRQLIEESTIDHWLPTYRIIEDGDTVTEGRLVDCDRVHLPNEFAGFGSLVVLTADLADGLEIRDSLSVFTDAQTVYASTDIVAVASPRWPFLTDTGEFAPEASDYRTAVHTFDITDPDRASYIASGSVRGHLLNQYSMSEYGGYLRIATTDGDPWWGAEEQSESFVTVLGADGSVLREVGQVGDLGRGEQIFAVRFYGETGYVVTYRQIDPLYTIDLSDPANPRVLGELKIPGFSSYLHRIDDEHLLGVGTDGDFEGQTDGAAVQLFDVGDLSNPELIAKVRFDDVIGVGGGDTYTPVSWDARAFTLWGDVALIPVEWWRYDETGGFQGEEQGAAVVLVRVGDDGTLTPIGQVSHPITRECESGVYLEEVPADELVDPATGEPEEPSGDAEASFVDDDEPAAEVLVPAPDEYCFTWAPAIQRSVIIDGDLYTVSAAGVRVNVFDGLDEVAWIPFG